MIARLIAFLISPTGFLSTLGVVALLMGGVYIKGRSDGKEACDARIAAAVAKEQARQAQANKVALEAAYARAEELMKERRALETTLEELANEAREDPDADRCGVSVDGVRRIDRVR